MIPKKDDLATLRYLILKSQEEDLNDSEVALVNELAKSDAGSKEAVALIHQWCSLSDEHSLDSPLIADELKVALSDQTIWLSMAQKETVAVRPSTAITTNSDEATDKGNYNWLLALVASNLIIASITWSVATSLWTTDMPFTSFPAPEPSAARNAMSSATPQLVSMTACVWRSSGESDPSVGVSIKHGETLDLVEGIAELRVGKDTSGEALVRLEGPASIFIRADGQLGLRHGTLTAKSLGTGSGNVTVDAPLGEVLIDGQSSIGLIANGTLSELHVFAGNALVKPSASASTTSELHLTAGEAVRFSSPSGSDFGVVMFEASLSSFVSGRSPGFDPLNLGDDYAQVVLESRPSIYWRFEEVEGEPPYHVVNQGSASNMDAQILGEPSWRRYGQNQVADLGKLGTESGFSSSGFWPQKPIDEYTVELWVKPELYHHGEVLCMHERLPKEDGRYPHAMLIETLASLAPHWKVKFDDVRSNAFRFLHRTPASGSVLEGSNLASNQPYKVRTWQHLAAVKKDGRMSIWLDGTLSAEQADPSPLNKNMQIVIGQLYLSKPERRFVGQIDEVAIYDRCLPPEELQLHIKAAGRQVDIDVLNE